MKKLFQIFTCAAIVAAAGFIIDACATSFKAKEVEFNSHTKGVNHYSEPDTLPVIK